MAKGFFKKKNADGSLSKDKAKKKFALVFTTIGDVGGLIVSFIYISFVALSMIVGFGENWLNWVMLSVTVLYVGFFIFKIAYLNRAMQHVGRMAKIVKISKKYFKLAMRIINATFVVLSLVSTQQGNDNVFALTGVVVVGLTFIITILWDIVSYFIRRKIHNFARSWAELIHDEKAERIEQLVTGLITSVNNAAIIDDYFDVALNIQRMIGKKLNDRVRLAEARRIEHTPTQDDDTHEEVPQQ
jgi:hypothetical protein